MRQSFIVAILFLGLAGCGSALGRAPDSGLSGRVVAGPSCPVERLPPEPGCAPRPLVATLRIGPLGNPAAARRVSSRRDGRFRVILPPGTYTVQALPRTGSSFPRPPLPRRVRIRSGHFTAITITYDTGIR